MHLLYNGIFLDVQRVLRRDLTYVLDPSGVDLLYEKHTVDVLAVYHANRTSYEYDSQTRKLVPTPGVSPGLTDVALRSALGEPRKPLFVYSGEDLVLAVPRPGQAVDANNGPKPLNHDIVEVLGRHTFLVRFRVEACVRECPPDSPLPQFILSSRYETSHDVDSQHRTAITTSGVTLFRTDLLEANKLQPDHFRSQVIPPIPRGFRRLTIKVTSKPARNALVWSVVDREEFEPVGDPFVRNAKGKPENPWGLVDFQAVMTGSTMGAKEAAASTHALQSITCVAVGNKSSSRYKLLQFCMSVAMSKCKVGIDGVVLRHLEIASHLHERTVQLQCVVQMPEAKPGKPKGLSGISALFSGIWRQDKVEALARNSGGSYQPPIDDATRGTYPYTIVAGNFAGACQPLLALNVLDPDEARAEPSETVARPSPSPSPLLAAAGREVASGAEAARGQAYDGGGVPAKVDVAVDVTANWPATPSLNKRRRHWYANFDITVRHDFKSGKLVAPVALPMATGQVRFGEPTVDVLQVHAPYSHMTVAFKGGRIGEACEVPDPQPLDRNLELLDGHVTLGAPRTLEDGRSSTPSRASMNTS